MNASSHELRELTADELEDVTGATRGNLAGLLRNLGKHATTVPTGDRARKTPR